MKQGTKKLVFAWTIASLTLLQTAEAASIGINFVGNDGGTNATTTLLSADSAGVVPQINWNNVTGQNGPVAVGTLVNDSNVATTVAITNFGAGGTTWNSSNSFTAGSGDNKLMRGGLESYALSTFPSKVQGLTGIPYSTYDVYVYFNAGGNNLTPGATVNLSITGSGSGAGSFNYTPINNPGSWVAATGAGGAADYAVFHITGGSSTDSLTINQGFALDSDKQVGLNGIQIVSAAVPEPAALSLLGGLASMALAARRRQ